MSFPPKMVVCVGAVVVKEDKVLFVRQTYGAYKGQWSIPWGFSNLEDGTPQAPHETAVRETLEEGGITAEVDGLIGIQNDTVNGEAWLYLLFLCHHVAGEPTPDNVETDAAVYLSLDEMETFPEVIEPLSLWLAPRALQNKCQIIPFNGQTPFIPNIAFV